MSQRVIIADDHPLFRTALNHAVSRVWDDPEVVEASSAGEARAALESGPAEALLLDLHMADSNGLTVLMDLRQDYPALPIAIVSASEEPRVYAAANQLGAAAFIPKSAGLDQMRDALLRQMLAHCEPRLPAADDHRVDGLHCHSASSPL